MFLGFKFKHIFRSKAKDGIPTIPSLTAAGPDVIEDVVLPTTLIHDIGASTPPSSPTDDVHLPDPTPNSGWQDDASSVTPTRSSSRNHTALKSSIMLFNLVLPIAEVFTPLKAAIGALLASAKLLDQRNANIEAVEDLLCRADDILALLSAHVQEDRTQDGAQRSIFLTGISRSLTRRILGIVQRLNKVAQMNSFRIEEVSSALESAKSELDRCVEIAMVRLLSSYYRTQGLSTRVL
ncbi:hypothetical protein CVT24_003668 [Panaeolus cyanescens]|uniref:Uncharacterized protein n=1 Tax=Panaeolus cyanescens TaxID=181874 RepID=A0A409W8E5_9AGAR|nr:hypothetical protein CVT24_003668 [Panaeolus cyanescens]